MTGAGAHGEGTSSVMRLGRPGGGGAEGYFTIFFSLPRKGWDFRAHISLFMFSNVFITVSGHGTPTPWTTTPRIITRQNNYPLGQETPRTTTPRDNYPLGWLPPGQLPSRTTTVQDNYLPDKYPRTTTT